MATGSKMDVKEKEGEFFEDIKTEKDALRAEAMQQGEYTENDDGVISFLDDSLN